MSAEYGTDEFLGPFVKPLLFVDNISTIRRRSADGCCTELRRVAPALLGRLIIYLLITILSTSLLYFSRYRS